MIIISLAGTNGAGKNTVAERLRDKWGFLYFSARDILIEELEKRGWPTDREHMRKLGDGWRAEHHPAYVLEKLYRKGQETGQNTVIESIRAIGEAKFLKDQPNAWLVAVDADPKIRYQRSLSRNSSTDQVTFEEFLAHEKAEAIIDDPTKMNVPGVIALADFVIRNDGSIEDFDRQIDEIVTKIKGLAENKNR